MAQSNVVRLPQANALSGSLEGAVSGFLSYCRSKNLADRTIEYYQMRLAAFVSWSERQKPDLTPAGITEQVARDFITAEVERVSASMGQHAFTALKAFLTFLYHEGFLDHHPMERMEKPRAPRKVIQTFSLEQVDSIIALCDPKTFIGCRDRAILFMLIDCGLRASELCGLEIDDIDWTGQTVLVRHAKGSKERQVPFGLAARQALSTYVCRRGDLASKTLFVTVYGEGFDHFRLRLIIMGRCEAAGIKGVRCSPHTLRHSMAVSYLRNGGDVFSLQKMLGHASLEMTRRYAELSQTDVQDKHRLYSPADRLASAKNTSGRKRLR